MSYLDPHGGRAAPGDRAGRPDDAVGDGQEDRHWARHPGAGSDPYAERYPAPAWGAPTSAEPVTPPPGWPPAAGRPATDPPLSPGRPDAPVPGRPAGEQSAWPTQPGRDDSIPARDGPGTTIRPDAAEPPSGPRPSRGRRRAGRSRPPTANRSGRAGRNLPAAIGVGVGLVAIILAALFLWAPGIVVVVAVAVSIGSWEMARAVRGVGAHPPLPPLIAGGLLMSGLAWFAGPDALALGVFVTVLATLVWRLPDGPANYQRDMTAATLIAVYVPFLLGFAVLLAVPDDGAWRVLVTLAAVVLTDTGGYAAGVWLGKRPMAPSISPKKSWEGFAGSVLAAAAGSALLLYLIFDLAPWQGALFGAALAVAAVLGDLAESMMKRDLGIKDMSNLLPGHGGLMDRLDSILFAVPTAYLLLSLLAPPG